MEEYTYLDEQLSVLLPNSTPSFSEMLGTIIRGEEVLSLQWLFESISRVISGEITEMKALFAALLLLAVVTSVFYNFSGAFHNKQVADISFYFAYLLLADILLRTFDMALQLASSLMEGIVHFTEILMPAYLLTVAASSAFSTASSFYQLTIIAIYGVESVFPNVIVPLIASFVFGSFISGLGTEDKLQPMLDLLKKSVEFLFKLALSLVTGFGVVKAMVNPITDRMKTTTVQKVVAVIPGIGEVTEAVSNVMFGSAVLIKNGFGLAILIGLVMLCIGPVFKLLVLGLVVKLSAVFMGVFADRRSYRCTDRTAQACMMLLKAVICVVAMFFITIALVGMSTNG